MPVGAACDPSDGIGFSTLLSELVFRGAGGLNSKQLSDAFDRSGVRRDLTVHSRHMALSGGFLGTEIGRAIELLTTTVSQPLLPEESLDPVRSLCLQSLKGLEDDPQSLAMVRLVECHLPPPLERSGYGNEDVLIGAGIDSLREHWEQYATAPGSIIAVAGGVDPDAVFAMFEQALPHSFATAPSVEATASPQRGRHHFEADASQVHLGLAFDGPPESDSNSMVHRVAIRALGGASSARLFTQVRQKRSLCYSVGASYRAGKDHGYVTIYAGTTPERAKETLEVCQHELAEMAKGIQRDEFERTVVGLKSRIVMQGESTRARAASLAADMDRLGQPRTLAELAHQIDVVTLDQVNAYLASTSFEPQTTVTLGAAGTMD